MFSVCISIVSHGHGSMVSDLVDHLLTFPEVAKIVVTFNISEGTAITCNDKVSIVKNNSPKGFGENHNFAFKQCKQDLFCPLNPDIAFINNPFPTLLNHLMHEDVGLVAPSIVSPCGNIEDSWRYFPTLFTILKKVFFSDDGRLNILNDVDTFSPDWVAGMFMLFRSRVYSEIGGFDGRFFLYYEDVDICARLRQNLYEIVACSSVSVIHDARRDSRRKFRHLVWHLSSMFRFLIKYRGSVTLQK